MTANDHSSSVSMLRLAAGHLKKIKYPLLVRPAVGPKAPATRELVNWGIQAYSLPWIRHISALLNGIILLADSDNRAAVRIIGRSSFEFSAHTYYVKKHVKQHLDANDLNAAWNFLLPIGTGSRYINEFHHPEDSAMFPAGPHISKAINCFREVMKGTDEDYSYLSEFCHPNTMTFQQHYHWKDPYTIEFKDQIEFGAFGAIAASALHGLMIVRELLLLGDEHQVSSSIGRLLAAIVKQEK